MKFQKTTRWIAEFDNRVATITKYNNKQKYFWQIQAETIDFGFGDCQEWETLSGGQEDTLALAKKPSKRIKNE